MSNRLPLAAGILFFLLSVASAASAGPEASFQCPDCNLIMISLSNVSVKHMSLYGYQRSTTPMLDDWAKHAVVFDNAFTHASWTLPVAVSLFTSLYPFTHGIMSRRIQNKLYPQVLTLPEFLKEHGYHTAAFTGGLDYDPVFSHMRGFEEAPSNSEFSKFEVTVPQAEAWLAKHKKEKFMLFLHGYDSHCPFKPEGAYHGVFAREKGKHLSVDATRCVRGFQNSAGYTAFYAGACGGLWKKCEPNRDQVQLNQDDIEYLSELYDDRILDTDKAVAGFLGRLDPGLLKHTIIVIFSDHGEMFAKHGRFGRVGTIRGTHYDDVLHIPLLIRFPSEISKRVRGLAQIVDIMPTVLQVLGIPRPKTFQGVSLMPLMAYDIPVNRYIYGGAFYNVAAFKHIEEADFTPYRFASWSQDVRNLQWKLIVEGTSKAGKTRTELMEHSDEKTVELYDIVHDPEELKNVANAHRDVVREMSGALRDWRKKCFRYAAHGPETNRIPEHLLKQAQQRGYW